MALERAPSGKHGPSSNSEPPIWVTRVARSMLSQMHRVGGTCAPPAKSGRTQPRAARLLRSSSCAPPAKSGRTQHCLRKCIDSRDMPMISVRKNKMRVFGERERRAKFAAYANTSQPLGPAGGPSAADRRLPIRLAESLIAASNVSVVKDHPTIPMNRPSLASYIVRRSYP